MFGLIITLLSVASTIVLATVVLRNNRHSALHFFLFLLSLGFAGSIGSNYFTTFYHDGPQVLSWIRWTMFFAGLAIPSWYLFLRNFPHRHLVVSRATVGVAAIATVVVMALARGPWMFTSVTLKGGNISPNPGFGLGVFFLVFALYLVGMIRVFVHGLRTLVGIERTQLQYVLGATGISFAIIILFNVVAPFLFHSSAYITLTNVAPLVFTGVVAFTIVRYRLLDIRVILRRTTVYFLTFAVILGIAAILVDFGSQNLAGMTPVAWSLLVLALGLVAFDPLKTWIEHLANRYFFTSLYNDRTTLAQLGRELTHTIDLQRIINSVVETIKETMKLDRAAVLLHERTTSNYEVIKNIGFNEENGIALVRSNFLTDYLSSKGSSVLLQELEGLQAAGKADAEIGKLVVNMKRIEASLCLPLRFGRQLIGIIVLGSKVSKDAYTTEDIYLLDSIADQASIAIQNGLLYQQVEDLNRNLQSRVDEQTRDIAEKNERLEALLKMKSEFLSIASHQLRTPLTAIRGLLSMQADGDLEKLPKEEQKRQQQNMLASANRLGNIVNDLLDAMELEGGVPHLTMTPVDLTAMIEDICKELKPNYDRKGLSLNVLTPNPLPPVTVEPKMFREAMENLIDNAEKYTNKGGTTVALSQRNGAVVIAITDTGIGIPKSDMPRLFRKFSRGEKSTYQHTDGSGLGLFIAKSIVTNHHGTIGVASDGEGKGTTVTVTIPIPKTPPAAS